jgi:glucose-1-phosphate adenylyltransferase
MRFLPASRIQGARLRHCLISDGSVIQEGADLDTCVIGIRSRLAKNVTMRNTVVLGADRYETQAERNANREQGRPDLLIGEGAVIERAILDKEVRIGRNVKIVNRSGARDAEGDNYVIRDGIVCIPRGTVIPDGTVI